MAEQHKVELFLKQNITDALKSAGRSIVDTRAGLAKVGPAAKSSFAMAGNAMTMLNQSLEVGKKAVELFRATLGASIETSLQFRRVGDDNVKYFKDLNRESQLIKARLGDALLPVVRGFTEAIKETIGSISGWIAENRKLIGSGLIDFLGTTSKLLTSGIANAVSIVAKSFLGWQIIIDGVKVAVNSMFSGALAIINDFLATTQAVAEQVGAKGLAASIARARESVQGLGAEFDSSSEAAQRGILETAEKIDKVEKTIRKVETSVKSVIERGMVKAQEHVQKATVGLTKTIDEQTDALARQGEMIDKIMQRRVAAIEAEQALREKDARSIDAQQQAAASGDTPMTGAGIGNQLLSGTGSGGAVVSSFMEGGPMAGLAEIGGMILESSEALSGIIGGISDQFQVLFTAMEPLFQAIRPVVDVVGSVVQVLARSLAPLFRTLGKVLSPILIALVPIIDLLMTMNPIMLALNFALGVLQPVIEGLAKVLKKVASFILGVGEAIAGVWNGIVDAIASLLKKLGSISVFGAKPLGFLEDWGNDLVNKARISTDSFDEARRRMEEGYDSMSDSIDEGAVQIAESTKEIQDSMSNVPSGIKLAYEKFRAATGTERAGSGTMDFGTQRAITAAQSSQAVTNFLGPVNVNGVTDVKKLQEEIIQEARQQFFNQYGSLAGAMGAF